MHNIPMSCEIVQQFYTCMSLSTYSTLQHSDSGDQERVADISQFMGLSIRYNAGHSFRERAERWSLETKRV